MQQSRTHFLSIQSKFIEKKKRVEKPRKVTSIVIPDRCNLVPASLLLSYKLFAESSNVPKIDCALQNHPNPSIHNHHTCYNKSLLLLHHFFLSFVLLRNLPLSLRQILVLDVQQQRLVELMREVPSDNGADYRREDQRPHISVEDSRVLLDDRSDQLEAQAGCWVYDCVAGQPKWRRWYLRVRNRETGIVEQTCQDLTACDVNLLVSVSTQMQKMADPSNSLSMNLAVSIESQPSRKGGSISPINAHDHSPPKNAPSSCPRRYNFNLLCLFSTYIPIVITGLIYPPVTSPVKLTARNIAHATMISGAMCRLDEHAPQTSMKLPSPSKKIIWNMRLLMRPFIFDRIIIKISVSIYLFISFSCIPSAWLPRGRLDA